LTLQGRWLLSLTRITYLCKLIGIHSIAAFLQGQGLRISVVKAKTKFVGSKAVLLSVNHRSGL
jgi:hypothetical protein